MAYMMRSHPSFIAPAAFSAVLTAFVTLIPASAAAQESPSPNTLAYHAETTAPPASITDMAWLEGHWRGEALGGLSEEIWSPPLAGAMTGMYKLVQGDKVIFYELFTIAEEGESLVLKLKHFNADLTGWEEKDEVRRFPLVKRDDKRMYFDGLTYERVGPDEIRVFLKMRDQNGEQKEETFDYSRVK